MSTSGDSEEWVSLHAIDPDLVRRVARGRYQVDPYAVADAMLRRRARLNELRRLSRMLVAAEGELPSAGTKQP